ncbi:MAG: preprotein translocase subunit YajC [Clostridiales bacterium]|jgi:preprotein translocase subunit YajC|nr:preprotein translocase subunit YajC [Clostridiales bacterium]
MNLLIKSLSVVPAEDTPQPSGGMTLMLILLGVFVVAIFFVSPMLRKKRQSKVAESLHNSIQVGCVVKTIGGLIGKVVAVNVLNPLEKEVVLETGMEDSKSTLTFDIFSIYTILTLADGSKYVPIIAGRKGSVDVQTNDIKFEKEDDKLEVQSDFESLSAENEPTKSELKGDVQEFTEEQSQQPE